MMLMCSPESTTNPSRAILIAGAITWARDSRPYLACAATSPATAPGTPLDRHPMMLPSVVPSGFRYMSREPASGATSR